MIRKVRQRLIAVGFCMGTLAAVTIGCSQSPSTKPSTIVASVRAEPHSFNRYVARDLTSDVVSQLTNATLVKIDRTTNELKPELAESWTLLPDEVTYRLTLRKDAGFSDGTPFTSADVVFSFQALYDADVSSVFADTLMVAGRPLGVAADDNHTVTIRFPSRFGPGLRILDGVPMLPKHRLKAALDGRTFRLSWSIAAPDHVVGLGPFRLLRYQPGERIVFERNPYHWRAAEVARIHAADRIDLEIVPDQDSEALGLESGQLDFTQSEIRPSDFAAFRRSETQGRLVVRDLGVAVDGDLFWVNLSPRAADRRRPWLQQSDLRRAISLAIDRAAFVDQVYLGAAVAADGIVSPGNVVWHHPQPVPQRDLEAARRLLDRLGLRRKSGAAIRVDANGEPARFTLLTQAGNTSLERGAAFIRAAMAEVGVEVDVAALEVNALIARIQNGDYEAAYFRLLTTDTDPALNLDFWVSSGSAHMWQAEQSKPATAWEQEIDRLMMEMATSLESDRRHQLFDRVQDIWANELPAICFAFPRVWIAMNPRIRNSTPASFRPPVLWNAAALSVG